MRCGFPDSTQLPGDPDGTANNPHRCRTTTHTHTQTVATLIAHTLGRMLIQAHTHTQRPQKSHLTRQTGFIFKCQSYQRNKTHPVCRIVGKCVVSIMKAMIVNFFLSIGRCWSARSHLTKKSVMFYMCTYTCGI